MKRRRQRVLLDTYELPTDEKDNAIDRVCAFGGHPCNGDVYDPRATQRVPEGGAWAMIVRALPPIEGGLHEHIRVGRVFYVEHLGNADKYGFAPDGAYKVQTHSPWGTVSLWPYEYTVLPGARVTTLWAEGALIFHPLKIEDARLNDIVFYARSRGVALADAVVMAVGSLQGAVGWFEPATPALAAEMESIAARINQWPWDTTKRKAAQARRKRDEAKTPPVSTDAAD